MFQHRGRVLFGVLVLLLLSVILIILLGYSIQRTQTLYLVSSFTALFIIQVLLYRLLKAKSDQIIWFGIFFRVLLLFAIPSLSDDVYRWIWDASLFVDGINPFSETPIDYVQNYSEDTHRMELFNLLSSNTQQNHTIYPPVAQFTTSLAYLLAGRDLSWTIYILHLFMLVSETLILIISRKLLPLFGFNESNIALYALNPLVILEMMGNLHHESYMILFCLGGVYYLKREKVVLSSSMMSFSIASKLLPVMFMPLFIGRLSWLKLLRFFAISGVVTLILFLPFLSEDFLTGMRSSTSLYFQKFEFNASIFYLVREWGFWRYGYDIIQTAGPRLAIITSLALLVFYRLSYLKKLSLPESFMWILVIYLSTTSIFHPWYLIPIVAFSMFTHYRFTLLWSFLIFFTYSGYTEAGFQENFLAVIIEYSLVYGVMIYEIVIKSKRDIRLY